MGEILLTKFELVKRCLNCGTVNICAVNVCGGCGMYFIKVDEEKDKVLFEKNKLKFFEKK